METMKVRTWTRDEKAREMYEQTMEEKGEGSRLSARSNKLLRNVLQEEIFPMQTLRARDTTRESFDASR